MVINYIEFNLKVNSKINSSNDRQKEKFTRMIIKLREWSMQSVRRFRNEV